MAYPDDPLFPRLLDMLEAVAARQPDAPALVHLAHPDDTDPRVVTFGELVRQIHALASSLRDAGVEPADSVAILSPTTPDTLIAFVAAATVASAFPVNPLLTPQALAQQLSLARSTAVVVHGPDALMPVRDKLLATLQHANPVRTVVEIDTANAAETPWPDTIRQLAWRDLVSGTASVPATAPEPRRVAALFHTGGTSGNPKLAELGESALAAGPQLAAVACNWLADDRVLSLLPHFHVGGTLCIGLAALSVGASVYSCGVLGGRDPALIENLWEICYQHRITLPTMVPTSWSAVLDTATGPAPPSLRGVMTGGAAAPVDVVQRVERYTFLPMSQVFGMTELSGICTAQPVDGTFRPHAVGYAPAGMELELEPVGNGLSEVKLKGPNMFLGYRTAEGRVGELGEWLRSGDLGMYDEEGQLCLLGRSKDVIIRSGHNIDPLTIEEPAYAHPGVAEAVAVGFPDAYAGDVPVLFVVPAGDDDLSGLEELLAETILEPPARPKRIIPIDALPLTPVGKVERYKLRQRAAEICTEELLEDMRPASIACSDPAARAITLEWADGTDDAAKAEASKRLQQVGLHLV